MQSMDAKPIGDLQFEFSQKNNLHKAEKSGSFNCASPHNVKWKLSQIKYLNTKVIDCHLDNLKVSGDSIQGLMLLHSNTSLLIYVGTCFIVEIPNFDAVDELFRYEYFIVC